MILDAGPGTTLPGVSSPERDQRRARARALRAEGRTLNEIAATLGVPKYTVQDDLRLEPKPSPRSIRFPPDVDAAVNVAALREGISESQVVIRSVRAQLMDDDK